MGRDRTRLTWGGNQEAQRQADEAFAKLKPKGAPKGKQRRNKSRSGQFVGTYQQYLKSPQWAKKRRKALKHYGQACTICKSRQRLEVHHRHYRTLFRESVLDLDVLCHGCHANHHEDKGALDPLAAEYAAIAASF